MKHFSNLIYKTKSKAVILIVLSWLVYTISYLGKVNYSANITQIIDYYGISKTQAGIVPTFFFFAYGIGQVFNGLFCKKYNIKLIVFISLTLSGIINLMIALGCNFSMMKWLWLVNGFALSVLWPTIIRLISEVLPKKDLGNASVVMGTSVAVGTMIVYGLSSIFVAFNKFKLSFYTAGITMISVAVIWMVLYNKAVKTATIERNAEIDTEKTKTEVTIQKNQEKNDEKKLLFATIYVLCFSAIGVNLIKDGLTTWVPSILKEEFSVRDSLSILLTLLLPILAMFGNGYSLKMHRKFPDYVNHCGATFAVIAVLIAFIIASITLKLVSFTLLGLVVVNFLASSLNGLITSIFPLLMRGKINSGLIAGVLNGFCYVGSTISSYGLGLIADNYGWIAVFWSLISFCTLVFIVWGGFIFLKYYYKRKICS